ncbi:hypothetical protein [Antarctobacter sp.]|uniref:hypothetical protein n=1 Tax=Antarctobacter sp. TaxID=1872577 RepID=UPI002B26A3B9|nr:hypothetical protein [Antarctobacter sp.]
MTTDFKGITPIHNGLSSEEILESSVPEAMAHYQAVIDEINEHFWNRDWTALTTRISVPNRITALDAARLIDTHEEWLTVARAARHGFNTMGISEYHRVCRGAYFVDLDEQQIVGFHETYILRGCVLAVPRFKGFMRMVLRDGRWRSEGLHTEQREALLPTIHADQIVQARD